MKQSRRGRVLWVSIVFCYVFFQVALYAQDQRTDLGNTQQSSTPWEHLSLEGALALAVGVLYRENRSKESQAAQTATSAAAAITKSTDTMEAMTKALERLTGKVENCPVRLGQPPSRP